MNCPYSYRSQSQSWITFRATLLLLLVLAGTGPVNAQAQSPGLIRVTAENQAAFGIQLAAPVATEETLSQRYPGKVAVPNRQMRVVSAPQGGMLEALLVAEGEQVEQGQELARLRSPELLQTQSDYLEAVTRLKLAASELARNRKLYSEGIIAERRLLESRAAESELSTAVDRYRQRLELTGMVASDIEQLRRNRRLSSTLAVRAPLSGVVLEQMVSTGQAVAAADPLYRVARLDSLWLEIHVPANRLGNIRLGDRVILAAQGIEGQVITVGRMVHEADQGVLVRAEVQRGVEQLRPGQFVEVQLATGSTAAAWRVATAAVVRNAQKSFVFAAREGGFTAIPVEILAEEERDTVLSGTLEPSDRIAVKGVAALKAAWLGGAE